jgi:glycosyltransferase involved in cell wall biosynthesis
VKPRLLVVTSVHPPDDPRIRERLIRSLEPDFNITYATQQPGPSDRAGIEWMPLDGGRRERRTEAGRLLLSMEYDIAVVHDPELLPGAIKAAKTGRTVVFDLHEHLPAQISIRPSIPAALRPIAAKAAGRYLRRAEKHLDVTLAEAGYQDLFTDPHPVFPNFPRYEGLPAPRNDPDGPIVYVGDVTKIRGAATLIEAAGKMLASRPVLMVGRRDAGFRSELTARAEELGVDLEMTGWLPHPEAMRIVAEASVCVAPLHDVPNYRHSLPSKTLEYLALGVPVVASDLPGTREVIGRLAGVVLIEPDSATALGSALDDVLGDPSIGEAARSGASTVRERFVWPEDEVRRYYRSLLP